jgi:hypothetical protein
MPARKGGSSCHSTQSNLFSRRAAPVRTAAVAPRLPASVAHLSENTCARPAAAVSTAAASAGARHRSHPRAWPVTVADDVGLGKTIQAGLAIAELRARGAADRVLIVTPADCEQWADELSQRFDIAGDVVDFRAVAQRAAPLRVNPWTTWPTPSRPSTTPNAAS